MRPNLLLNLKRIKTQLSLDLKPRTDLGGTTSKNSPVIDRLIRPEYNVAKSVTKTSNKV